jgi:hypothetical protein
MKSFKSKLQDFFILTREFAQSNFNCRCPDWIEKMYVHFVDASLIKKIIGGKIVNLQKFYNSSIMKFSN